MGGAGFPTAVKLAPKNLDEIDTLVINGAECEPYITSDNRCMIEDTHFIFSGIKAVMKHLNIAKCVIGIEGNKPEAIAKMKDGVVIINTSRGTNVDEAALLDALNSGKVRAAGLDVYADEPATNVALYSHPMVSCTPHIGSATVEAQGRIGEELVEIISKM